MKGEQAQRHLKRVTLTVNASVIGDEDYVARWAQCYGCHALRMNDFHYVHFASSRYRSIGPLSQRYFIWIHINHQYIDTVTRTYFSGVPKKGCSRSKAKWHGNQPQLCQRSWAFMSRLFENKDTSEPSKRKVKLSINPLLFKSYYTSLSLRSGTIEQWPSPDNCNLTEWYFSSCNCTHKTIFFKKY